MFDDDRVAALPEGSAMRRVLHVLVVVEGAAKLRAEFGNALASLLKGRVTLWARLRYAVVAE